MRTPRIIHLALLLALLFYAAGPTLARGHGRSHSRHRRSSRDRGQKDKDAKPAVPDNEVHLHLTDGSVVVAEEAWESPQGIWYQRRGMTYLLARERVKSLERGARVEQAPAAPQPAATATASKSPSGSPGGPQGTPALSATPAPETAKVTEPVTNRQPTWIYLKGGARVEADSA